MRAAGRRKGGAARKKGRVNEYHYRPDRISGPARDYKGERSGRPDLRSRGLHPWPRGMKGARVNIVPGERGGIISRAAIGKVAAEAARGFVGRAGATRGSLRPDAAREGSLRVKG